MEESCKQYISSWNSRCTCHHLWLAHQRHVPTCQREGQTICSRQTTHPPLAPHTAAQQSPAGRRAANEFSLPEQSVIAEAVPPTHAHEGESLNQAKEMYLGRCIVGAAAGGGQEVAIAHDVGQPKVGNLQRGALAVAIRRQQQVLRLQISVDHAWCVRVVCAVQ